MKRYILLGATLGATACGPMPGYYPRTHDKTQDLRPTSPPAPAQEAAPEDEATDSEQPDTRIAEGEGPEFEEHAAPEEIAPEVEPPRPPKPPRNRPAPHWTPGTDQAPPVETPSRPSQVRTIELDDQTSYIIDDARGLCFFQHKGSLAPVDCARLKEPDRAPSRTEPTPPADKPVPPEPKPQGTRAAPTPDEMLRFESAFTDIFCDRKTLADTAPENRIAARGLSVKRYEAIEAWWASDESAWWTLTQRAASKCR